MTITFELPEDMGTKLSRRASEAGQAPEAYVAALVQHDISRPPTFGEIFARFRHEVAESAMTSADVDALFEEALLDVRREERAKQPA